MLIEDLVHLVDRIKVPHDVSGAERLTHLHRPAVNLFNHDDDATRPLAAPRLIHDIGIESQPRQPRPLLAGLFIPKMIRTNESARCSVRVSR